MRFPRRILVLLGVASILFASIAALSWLPLSEHWRTQSPDGTFVAVARAQPLYALLPVMPGGGSDKPGWVTVYKGGRSCGAAPVEMVSFAYHLAWQLDARPRAAEIRLVARWNLDDCSVEIFR